MTMSGPTAGSQARQPFSYRWVILATGFGIMVLSSSLTMSFGVFVRTLIDDYGWTTSMVSLTYAIFMLSAGRLSDRHLRLERLLHHPRAQASAHALVDQRDSDSRGGWTADPHHIAEMSRHNQL
jgi:MFS family permease